MADQPAPPSYVDTPEFKAAVAEASRQAAAEAIRAVKEGLEHSAAASPAPASPSDPTGVLGGLALAIAQLTDQGGGAVKRVSPDEMRRREAGKVEMERLILEARAAGRPAVYQLQGKVFLDEAIIDPMWLDSSKKAQATTIELDGVPNDSMIPVNDTAKAIHAAFMLSIGDTLIKPVQGADPYITPMGLVINGHAPARRDVASRSGGHARVIRDGERAAGEYAAVRVLGTIAEPAQQTV